MVGWHAWDHSSLLKKSKPVLNHKMKNKTKTKTKNRKKLNLAFYMGIHRFFTCKPPPLKTKQTRTGAQNSKLPRKSSWITSEAKRKKRTFESEINLIQIKHTDKKKKKIISKKIIEQSTSANVFVGQEEVSERTMSHRWDSHGRSSSRLRECSPGINQAAVDDEETIDSPQMLPTYSAEIIDALNDEFFNFSLSSPLEPEASEFFPAPLQKNRIVAAGAVSEDASDSRDDRKHGEPLTSRLPGDGEEQSARRKRRSGGRNSGSEDDAIEDDLNGNNNNNDDDDDVAVNNRVYRDHLHGASTSPSPLLTHRRLLSPSIDSFKERSGILRYEKERKTKRLQRLLKDYRQAESMFNGQYRVSRWLFLRLLGVVYFAALAGLWYQVDGLFSSEGVVPVHADNALLWSLLEQTTGSSVDFALHLACGLGCAGSLLLLLGYDHALLLCLLWLIYSSFQRVGQGLLSTHWDLLLCELGFVAIWLGSWHLSLASSSSCSSSSSSLSSSSSCSASSFHLSSSSSSLYCRTRKHQHPQHQSRGVGSPCGKLHRPSSIIIILCHWLAFRFAFEQGVSKLTEAWTDLSATRYLVQAQPLPSPLSFYLFHLSPVWHQLAAMLILLIELGTPFFLLGPRSFRLVGALLQIALHVAAMGTGNRGFFDLLVIALHLLILDDRFYVEHLPFLAGPLLERRTRRSGGGTGSGNNSSSNGSSGKEKRRSMKKLFVVLARRLIYLAIAATLFAASLHPFLQSTAAKSTPAPLAALHDSASQLGLSNRYGLPSFVPQSRHELVIQGSSINGSQWLDIELACTAGPQLNRRPSFFLLYIPRLDWALSQLHGPIDSSQLQPWLIGLLNRILEGSPSVLRLLNLQGSFVDHPPARLRLSEYETSFAQSNANYWWNRQLINQVEVDVTALHQASCSP